MSSLLSADLVATCNALGFYDAQENKYYADENTIDTIKDLIRYLRRDDESFDIRRQLGETKVVQTDLLPLLKNYWQQTELFDVLLRLLVNLSTPALILWQEEIPTERTARNQYLQIEEHLRQYKQAFADENVWAVLSTRISKILEIDSGERSDENGLIIERVLVLIRNVLHVPADPDAEKRPDNDASIHDQVLWSLHQSGLLDIILYMSNAESEQVYYMHILELLSCMFREQSATELANAAVQRSQTEKMRDEAELLAIRHRENNQKQQKVKQYNSTRHSRFGGTFVVKSMKSISDNELIYHRPLNQLEELDFDAEKSKSKTPSNRMPVQSSSAERRSAFSIRLFLKEFCLEFLNASYNTLMRLAKARLARARSQMNDDTYYLWAQRFFMEFNRSYRFEVRLVSETLSVEAFHYVQQKMETYYDMMSSDKRRLKMWARRLHLALLAYRELLTTMTAMDKSADEGLRACSKVIKSNVFYVLEYRELVLTLLVTYDELKMSRAYLRDLIQTQHVFVRLLEQFCGGKEGQVMVQAKKRAAPRRKKAPPALPPPAELNLENMWEEVSPQLSVVLEGNLELPTEVPFDAGSDEPIDDQKSEAMVRIQRKLRSHEFEGAIALLRASREVWPENDCFGTPNMPVEEEFMALREIFFADLGENDPPPPEVPVNEIEDDDEDEEAMHEESMRVVESDLKFGDFTKRLAHPKVVRAAALALVNFDTNTPMMNHCIVKLLHRIAVDCKMSAMLYQVSIFMTFQRIFDAHLLPQNTEIVKFATYILRQFMVVAGRNPTVYMEALFWKSSRDAFDIEEGYGSYQERSSATAKAWSELEEDELRRLFMEHSNNQIQEDVIDWITKNLIDNMKTRRMVIKKLKEMFLLVDYKPRKSKPGVQGKVPRQWSADEEAQLAELYEQFKDAMDPLTCVMDRLDVNRPKHRISEKLLLMGLVQDKKELRKKRGRKPRPGSGPAGGSDEDSDSSGPSSRPATKVQHKSKRGGKTSRHVRAEAGEVARLLIGLVDGEKSEALDWLKESFADAIEDLTNDPGDPEEGIPLVPILDCAISAMDHPEFLRLLRAFGIHEPSNEQETYWRIPASIDASELRAHCELLTKALEKTLTIPQETVAAAEPDVRQESSDEDVFDTLRKMTALDTDLALNEVHVEKSVDKGNTISVNDSNTVSNARENSVDTKPSSARNNAKNARKERIQALMKKSAEKNSSSFDLEIAEPPKIKQQPKPAKIKQKPKPAKAKRRVQIADSSDEETQRGPSEENPDEFAMFKPARIADTDSEPETQTLRNVLGSDDSDEDTSPPKTHFEPMKIVSSDDDDDGAKTKRAEKSVGASNSKRASKRAFLDSDDDSNDATGIEEADGSGRKASKRMRLDSDSDDDSNSSTTENIHNANTSDVATIGDRNAKSKQKVLDSDDSNDSTEKNVQSVAGENVNIHNVNTSDVSAVGDKNTNRTKSKRMVLDSDDSNDGTEKNLQTQPVDGKNINTSDVAAARDRNAKSKRMLLDSDDSNDSNENNVQTQSVGHENLNIHNVNTSDVAAVGGKNTKHPKSKRMVLDSDDSNDSTEKNVQTQSAAGENGNRFKSQRTHLDSDDDSNDGLIKKSLKESDAVMNTEATKSARTLLDSDDDSNDSNSRRALKNTTENVQKPISGGNRESLDTDDDEDSNPEDNDDGNDGTIKIGPNQSKENRQNFAEVGKVSKSKPILVTGDDSNDSARNTSAGTIENKDNSNAFKSKVLLSNDVEDTKSPGRTIQQSESNNATKVGDDSKKSSQARITTNLQESSDDRKDAQGMVKELANGDEEINGTEPEVGTTKVAETNILLHETNKEDFAKKPEAEAKRSRCSDSDSDTDTPTVKKSRIIASEDSN